MNVRNLERRLGLTEKVSHTNRFSSLRITLRRRDFDPFLLELPQHLDLMAALLENGESLYGTIVALRARGKFAKAMERLSLRLQLGESLEVALELMRSETESPAVAEFCSKLLLTINRGTPVAEQMRAMAQTTRVQLRNELLNKAGNNEVKMLIPLVFVILPTTIAFALFPSFQLLQIGI